MKEANTKDHILCGSIYMKCPGKANLQTQKVDYWLPMSGGRNRN